ncbi:Dolichyl-phosphate-mannose--protein mannosyltransferase family GT39 [Gracilaria domingensis]|nr:Dolichyl-phosphate-mannose--protein mannosyltransferase family GT39 [Gracilaria domingensis]
MALCLLCALRMWRAPSHQRTRWVVATALSGTAALSVKWTALVTPGLVAIVSLTARPFTKRRLAPKHILLAACITLSIYISLFWLHFRILIFSGAGDAFMKRSFRRTLINGTHYDPNAKPDGFVRNFVYLNHQMYKANKGIKVRHPWESRWWQWVINMRGLLYYNELNPEAAWANEKIYAIVNPVVSVVTVFWLVAFAAISGSLIMHRTKSSLSRVTNRKLQAFVARGLFFLAAFVLNLLPYLGKQTPLMSSVVLCEQANILNLT